MGWTLSGNFQKHSGEIPDWKILLPSKLVATECSLYLVPSLYNQRFCPGLSLHQPVPSVFALQGSHTCTANHTKFSELDAGWSGKPAFARGWTTHQPTAHKITYLSGYIFKMQMCPPQPATSAFYSWSQPTCFLLSVFLIISSFILVWEVNSLGSSLPLSWCSGHYTWEMLSLNSVISLGLSLKGYTERHSQQL